MCSKASRPIQLFIPPPPHNCSIIIVTSSKNISEWIYFAQSSQRHMANPVKVPIRLHCNFFSHSFFCIVMELQVVCMWKTWLEMTVKARYSQDQQYPTFLIENGPMLTCSTSFRKQQVKIRFKVKPEISHSADIGCPLNTGLNLR